MTIYCKLCKFPIQSRTAGDAAQAEVMKSMMNHLITRHYKDAEILKSDIDVLHQAIATYLLLKHYVVIPAEETALLRSYFDNEKNLANLFSSTNVVS